MNLSSEQTEFILDYFFRCSELEELAKGSELIASNHQAAYLYNALKQAFSHLDHFTTEECPSELVDLTLARLKLAGFGNFGSSALIAIALLTLLFA